MYIYMAIDILLWLINIIMLLSNYKNIRFNILSALALLPFLLMVVQAVLAYQYRHCENMLKKPPLKWSLAQYRVQSQRSTHTYSAEYNNEFSLMLAIYVGVMSFQLLVFVYMAPQFQFLMSFFLLMLPYIFFFVIWIYNLIKKGKAIRQKDFQLEKERLEQERREEQGNWK